MTGFNIGCVDEIDIFKIEEYQLMMEKIILR